MIILLQSIILGCLVMSLALVYYYYIHYRHKIRYENFTKPHIYHQMAERMKGEDTIEVKKSTSDSNYFKIMRNDNENN